MDNWVRLWDLRQGSSNGSTSNVVPQVLDAQSCFGGVRALAVLTDGRLAALGNDEPASVRVWR